MDQESVGIHQVEGSMRGPGRHPRFHPAFADDGWCREPFFAISPGSIKRRRVERVQQLGIYDIDLAFAGLERCPDPVFRGPQVHDRRRGGAFLVGRECPLQVPIRHGHFVFPEMGFELCEHGIAPGGFFLGKIVLLPQVVDGTILVVEPVEFDVAFPAAAAMHADVPDEFPVAPAHGIGHVTFQREKPVDRFPLTAVGLDRPVGRSLHQGQDVAPVQVEVRVRFEPGNVHERREQIDQVDRGVTGRARGNTRTRHDERDADPAFVGLLFPAA